MRNFETFFSKNEPPSLPEQCPVHRPAGKNEELSTLPVEYLVRRPAENNQKSLRFPKGYAVNYSMLFFFFLKFQLFFAPYATPAAISHPMPPSMGMQGGGQQGGPVPPGGGGWARLSAPANSIIPKVKTIKR